jgi:hypothetical protein
VPIQFRSAAKAAPDAIAPPTTPAICCVLITMCHTSASAAQNTLNPSSRITTRS